MSPTPGPGLAPDPTLAQAVVDAVAGLPPGQVEALARALETCAGPAEARGRLRAAVPRTDGSSAYARLADAWQFTAAHLTGPALALAVRSCAVAAGRERDRQQVEVVWTGPATTVVEPRMTRSVFAEVLSGAKRRVIATTFAAYADEQIRGAFRATAARGVRIDLVVESPAEHDGVLHGQFAAAFDGIPGIRTWVWPRDQRPDIPGIKMHAKVLVADHRIAFVTSANLTGHAYEHNMECGLLVRGGPAPGQLADHVDALIEGGVLVRV